MQKKRKIFGFFWRGKFGDDRNECKSLSKKVECGRLVRLTGTCRRAACAPKSLFRQAVTVCRL